MKPLIKALSLALAATILCAAAATASDTWIKEALKAKALTPPFRKTFYAGELLQVKLKKNMAVRLNMSEGSKGGLIAVIPMKDGKRSGPKVIIKDAAHTFSETLEEADVLALKIFTGIVNLEGDHERMPEVVIEKGQEISFATMPGSDMVGRFVNVSDFRSTCTYSFIRNGEDISKNPERHRTLNLEFRGSNRLKTWTTEATEVKVKVLQGKIIFKMANKLQE